MSNIKSDLQRAFDEGYEKGKADRPSAVDLSSVYSTAYKSGYEKGKADRPQGEWIDMGDFEQCSVCKGTHLKEFQSYYGKTTWVKTPYCPSCGARMKGVGDEAN